MYSRNSSVLEQTGSVEKQPNAPSYNKSNPLTEEQKEKSTLLSRNINILGRRTSVRLEPEMWQSLRDIAQREKCTIHEICTLIYLRKKKRSTLTASVRVFIMLYFKAAATDDGHVSAGHGCFEKMKNRARVIGDIRMIKTHMLSRGEMAANT